MNIGYLHNDRLPLKDAPSIQSYEIAIRLAENHKLFSGIFCPFPVVEKIYLGRKSILKFAKKIDLLFVIIDGEYRFEKFALLSIYKRKKIPVVWLINAPLEERLLFVKQTKLVFFLQKKLRRFFAGFVNLAICVSSEIEIYAKYELGISNTLVVPNGVDQHLFNPARKDLLFLKNNIYFNVVWEGNGQFRWHALDVIAKVAKKIEKLDKDVRFILITNGSWYSFDSFINVCVINSIEYKYIPDILRLGDLFLCLYYSQLPNKKKFYGSPMKLFEYMSMGKPVIGNKIGQIPEIIRDGVNGFLVNSLEVDKIVKKILYAKNNKKISNLIGKNARKVVVEKYNWDNMVKKIESEMIKL